MDEKLLSELFAAVDAPVYIEDVHEQRIVYWSPAAASLFGYTSNDSIPSSQLAAQQIENTSAMQGERGEVQRVARRFRRADGTQFEADVAISSMMNGEQALAVVALQLAAPIADVGPTERIDHAPTQNGGQTIGQLLRNLANYAVFTTDDSGLIREWNREASRLLGCEGEDVSGKPIATICAGDPVRALQNAFDQARERGASCYYQWLVCRGGRRLFARVAIFSLSNDARGNGFLFLLRDDSREPTLRQILREKEQMAAIGTAASILAHEIGNPLNGISATVQLLEHCLSRPSPPSPDLLRSSVEDLKGEVKRLSALLSSFKSIAWPVKLALAPVDLRRVIEPLVAQIQKRSARQNVEVAFECQAGLPLLSGDDDKLKEALLQVFENALDAMPHGGRLEIKAYRHGQTLCVDVIDTGLGIPKNLKVFDLFSSTKPDGIGLGLFMVQQIVLAHGGAITYSSAPGEGTTFHVTFALNPGPESIGADLLEAL